MKTTSRSVRVILIIGFLTLLSVYWAAAQEESGRAVLVLQFSAAPSEPPTIEEAGSTGVFKVNPSGTVTGDLEGTLSQRITQVDPMIVLPTNVTALVDVTTFFTIQTDEGTIEGYYYGAFYFPEATAPDATVKQQGKVLSVTAAYADLYLADVYYDGVVDFEEVDGTEVAVGDSGTIIIAPR